MGSNYQDFAFAGKDKTKSDDIGDGQIGLNHLSPGVFQEVQKIPTHNHDGVNSVKLDLPVTQIVNPYKFSVYRTAAFTTTGANFVQIPYDTEVFDTSNAYSTSTGRFTVLIPGYYFFTARASSTDTRIILSLYLNGAEVKRGADMGTATSLIKGQTVNALLGLVQNDYIEVYIRTDNNVALEVGSSVAYFNGFMVST